VLLEDLSLYPFRLLARSVAADLATEGVQIPKWPYDLPDLIFVRAKAAQHFFK
jgi:hypothetical protein